jgi:hypothetical protein
MLPLSRSSHEQEESPAGEGGQGVKPADDFPHLVG